MADKMRFAFMLNIAFVAITGCKPASNISDADTKAATSSGEDYLTRATITVTQDLPKPTCVASVLDSCFIEAGFAFGRFTADRKNERLLRIVFGLM